jgi:hypothetical protein
MTGTFETRHSTLENSCDNLEFRVHEFRVHDYTRVAYVDCDKNWR